MKPVRNLRWAVPTTSPPFATPRRARGRKRQGIKYEAAASAHFAALFGAAWHAGPWFQLCDDWGTRYCQPDGIVLRSDSLLIVEFKYQHTVDAWAQLRCLYQPVCELVYRRPAAILECVKWYDCALAYPEPVQLVADPAAWTARDFGVHIWKP